MTRYLEMTLSGSELMLCAQAGAMRYIENMKRGYQNKYNIPADAPLWQWHIEGCIGEYVMSRHLNILWKGKGETGTSDLANGDEVRMSESHANRLIIHKSDSDDARFWFVTGKNGVYRIHGYIFGYEAKQTNYWTDPIGGRPAFFVPTDDLTCPR